MERGIVPSEIYKILAAPSYDFVISMYDEDGQGTISPIRAKWFYVKPVNFMIQVPSASDALIRPEVYLWKSQELKDDRSREIMTRIKTCCNQYGYGFTVNDFGRGNLPKKFSHIAMRDVEETKLQESFDGSAFRSYYKLPKAKTIIVHSSRIDEENSDRTQNIKDIFIDCGGERFKLKFPNVDAAKAITMHMNESGKWGDRYSKHIESSSSDLEKLKRLLPELEAAKKNIHARKAKDFIDGLEKALKTSSSSNGYSSDIANLSSVPRVGKKYIEDFAKRMDISSDKELAMALARQYLMRECSNMSSYAETIYENMSDLTDVDPKSIVQLAKRICLGCLDINMDAQVPPIEQSTSTPEERVLMFGDRIASIIGDERIKDVLENILSKPYLEEKDASFIRALGNSALGKYRKGFVFGGTASSAYGSDGALSTASGDASATAESLEERLDESFEDFKKWVEKQ